MIFKAPIQTYIEHMPGDVLIVARSHITRVQAGPSASNDNQESRAIPGR